MATARKTTPPELYDADFYAWAPGQANLLRARRFKALDLENLIEEVEALTDTNFRAVLNAARVAMEPQLQLQYSPTTDRRSLWRVSVRERRRRVQIDLTPRIGRILDRELQHLYAWRATTRWPACATTARTPPLRLSLSTPPRRRPDHRRQVAVSRDGCPDS